MYNFCSVVFGQYTFGKAYIPESKILRSWNNFISNIYGYYKKIS
jgi:hypothetical protein